MNKGRAICGVLLLLCWALWFGGVMGLFLSVQVLFRQTDRAVFLVAAPRLFISFERYQLILAATAIVLCVIVRKSRTLLALLAIAAGGAIFETTIITPRIEALRIAGATHTTEFLRMHALSMCLYMLVAIALLFAGVVLAACGLASSDFHIT